MRAELTVSLVLNSQIRTAESLEQLLLIEMVAFVVAAAYWAAFVPAMPARAPSLSSEQRLTEQRRLDPVSTHTHTHQESPCDPDR